MKLCGFLRVAVGALVVSNGSAALQIDVSEIPDSGSSLWTLSGSSIVTDIGSAPTFAGNSDVTTGSQGWRNIGGSWSTQDGVTLTMPFTSTMATVTVDDGMGGMTTANLTAFRYGNGLGGFLALASDNGGDIPLAVGGSVSWTGSVVMPLDATDVSSFTSNDFGGMEINFAVIPEPSEWALLLLLLIGLMVLSGSKTRRRSGSGRRNL